MRFRNKKKFVIILLLILLITVFLIFQNNNLVISEYDYENNNIPSSFNGFKVVHISDLHNKLFGKDQRRILKKVENIDPDIIVITGDLIDRKKYNLDKAMKFINGAIKIAPIYYVSGNHEARSGKYSILQEQLLKAGVAVLDNEMIKIKKDNDLIDIIGVSDPAFVSDSLFEDSIIELEKTLENYKENDNFKILLSHRAELFDIYFENNMDIIFSGHAHGGQIRIPFVGGIIAPDQGFFPKHSQGVYTNQDSTMYVSRGLGNSLFPFRIFNRPEIIVVTLHQNWNVN